MVTHKDKQSQIPKNTKVTAEFLGRGYIILPFKHYQIDKDQINSISTNFKLEH